MVLANRKESEAQGARSLADEQSARQQRKDDNSVIATGGKLLRAERPAFNYLLVLDRSERSRIIFISRTPSDDRSCLIASIISVLWPDLDDCFGDRGRSL